MAGQSLYRKIRNYDELSALYDRAEERRAVLERELASSTECCDELRKENKFLSSMNETNSRLFNETLEKYTKIQVERTAYTAINERLEKEARDLKSYIRELLSMNKSALEISNSLMEQIARNEQEIDQLSKANAALSGFLASVTEAADTQNEDQPEECDEDDENYLQDALIDDSSVAYNEDFDGKHDNYYDEGYADAQDYLSTYTEMFENNIESGWSYSDNDDDLLVSIYDQYDV